MWREAEHLSAEETRRLPSFKFQPNHLIVFTPIWSLRVEDNIVLVLQNASKEQSTRRPKVPSLLLGDGFSDPPVHYWGNLE
jgi:hypothetical protein